MLCIQVALFRVPILLCMCTCVTVCVQKAACDLAKRLMKTASKVTEYLSMDDITDHMDDRSSSYQSTMHACFNLGFEVHGHDSFSSPLAKP